MQSSEPRSIRNIAEQRLDDLNSSLARQVTKVALGLFSAIPVVVGSWKPLQEDVGFLPAFAVECFVCVATVLTVRQLAGRMLRHCPCTEAALKRQIEKDSKELSFASFWEAYQLERRDFSTMNDPLLPIETIEGMLIREFRKNRETLTPEMLERSYGKYFGEKKLGSHPNSKLHNIQELEKSVAGWPQENSFVLVLNRFDHPNLSRPPSNP